MQNTQTIIMFVVFIGLMYFMMLRPQKKQQQKRQEMLGNLKKGDEVVTIGRLHGIVDSIDQETKTVTLDCDGVYLVFDLSAIGQVKPAKDTNEDKEVNSDKQTEE